MKPLPPPQLADCDTEAPELAPLLTRPGKLSASAITSPHDGHSGPSARLEMLRIFSTRSPQAGQAYS